MQVLATASQRHSVEHRLSENAMTLKKPFPNSKDTKKLVYEVARAKRINLNTRYKVSIEIDPTDLERIVFDAMKSDRLRLAVEKAVKNFDLEEIDSRIKELNT